jgi:hypothetical protein
MAKLRVVGTLSQVYDYSCPMPLCKGMQLELSKHMNPSLNQKEIDVNPMKPKLNFQLQ